MEMIMFDYEITDLGDTILLTVYADDVDEGEQFAEGRIHDLAALEEYSGVDYWDVKVITD